MSTLIARFQKKYIHDPVSGCWIWIASNNGRYGMIAGHDGRTLLKSHRAAWMLFRGPIPDGMLILHRCDVPLCVNPDHLFLGTQSDNMADMARKLRHRCHRGHGVHTQKLTEEHTREISASDESGPVLAERFGITRSRVNQIKRANRVR